eukprot:jgi/Orpsp1_1/1174573/evm.model.c7180000050617.2
MESKNEITITKRELSPKNYPIWADDLELYLSAKKLDKYLYNDEGKVTRITVNSKKYNKNKCIKFRNSKIFYYGPEVTEEMVVKDNKMKNYIRSSLGDRTKVKFDFKNKTAHEVWTKIKRTYKKSDEEIKLDINKELETMKYDRNSDFGEFLSYIEIKFDELEELRENLTTEKKFNFLYNSLPEDIAQVSNVLYRNNWEKCCEEMNSVIPRIKYLKEIRYKQNKVRCYKCGKLGHMALDFYEEDDKSSVSNYKQNNYERRRNNKYTKGKSGRRYSRRKSNGKGKAQGNNVETEELISDILADAMNTNYKEEEKQSDSATTSKGKRNLSKSGRA